MVALSELIKHQSADLVVAVVDSAVDVEAEGS